MKNPKNRISKKSKAAPPSTQTDVQGWNLDEVLIHSYLSDLLDEVALVSRMDRKTLATEAVSVYLEFARHYPDLAEAQPVVHFPDALLWVNGDCPLAAELADTAAALATDANSIATAALSVYLRFRRMRGKDWPVDVENIRYELSRASTGAKLAARSAIGAALDLEKFSGTVCDLWNVRDMIMLHPGLGETNRALTMLIDGYYQLCDGQLKELPLGAHSPEPKPHPIRDRDLTRELPEVPLIPRSWREVASIDFSGLDRDCEERIIYKTPGGKLKASKSCENEPVVIEDVTREQVVRWLLECVVPEEFEPDFRRALPNAAAKGGAH